MKTTQVHSDDWLHLRSESFEIFMTSFIYLRVLYISSSRVDTWSLRLSTYNTLYIQKLSYWAKRPKVWGLNAVRCPEPRCPNPSPRLWPVNQIQNTPGRYTRAKPSIIKLREFESSSKSSSKDYCLKTLTTFHQQECGTAVAGTGSRCMDPVPVSRRILVSLTVGMQL